MSAPSRVPILAIGLAAALLALSFPLADVGGLSGPLGWCALVAYAPVLVWVLERERASSTGHVFAISLLVHLLAYGAAFHWVVFHPNPTTVAASAGGVMTLALLASVPLALGYLARRLLGRAWLLPVWAALTLALEHLLSVGPWALPWPVLSMTQATLPHAGLARWIGAPGLTALVLLSNATVAASLVWFRRRSQQMRGKNGAYGQPSGRWMKKLGWMRMLRVTPWQLRGAGTVLGLTFLLAPLLPLPGDPPTQPNAEVSEDSRPQLLILQPGTDSEAWAQTDTAVVNHLMRQTTSALSPASAGPSRNSTPNVSTPDVIVWPETTISESLFAITEYEESFHEFVRSLPAPLLTGAMLKASRPRGSNSESFVQNTALWLDPSSALRDSSSWMSFADALDSTAIYAKHHLVPFAERVPFSSSVPALQTFAVPSGGVDDSGGIAGYVPGPGPTVFPPPLPPALSGAESQQGPALRIAPLICFETIIGPYAGAASRVGAASRSHPDSPNPMPSVLVGLSHVGWWGHSAMLPQYRALTSLRALETGLPVVVATVRAPSFTARPDGSETLHTDWMQNRSVRVPVPEASRAPFAAWAGWINAAIALLLVVLTWGLEPSA